MTPSPDSTEQNPPPQMPQLDGRTVREIVEHNHEMVSESWCRRIIRQVLQSLEVQYGMRMPHRLITPDTLLILDSGDPMLLPSSDEEPAPEDARATEARDLRDLAAVVHYAITLDLAPTTPLQGRAPAEYSAGFIDAIDRCLAPDPALRLQTIDELREMLGIVVLGPPVVAPMPALADEDAEAPAVPAPATAAQAGPAPVASAVQPAVEPSVPPSVQPAVEPSMPPSMPPSVPPAAQSPAPPARPPMRPSAHVPFTPPPPSQRSAAPAPRRRNRAPLIGGAVLLLAALGALAVYLFPVDAGETQMLSPAPVLEDPQSVPAAPLVTLPAEQSRAPLQLQGPVIDEVDSGAPATPWPAPAADTSVPPTAVQLAPQGTPPDAAVAGTTYTLQVKPWGTIIVDGVERGASPPLRHITLPPGEHMIRIVNPGFPEHTVTVQSVQGRSSTIELDFTEEAKP